MAIKLVDKPNTSPPDATYPFGNIKDDTGVNDGTPLNQLVHADFHQFFAGLLEIWENYGMGTVNGLPDNDVNGFQYQLAFASATRLANRNLLKYLAETICGELLPSTPYALVGLESGVSPAIAPGYIYYQGDLYVCAGITPAITLDAQFNKTNEGVLTITDSATPGLFQYADLIFVQATTNAVQNPDQVITKVVNIGVWDMDTTASVNIAHGIASMVNIRSISALIINDAGNVLRPIDIDLGTGVSGYQQATPGGNISLARVAAGIFDDAGYSGAGNRGTITIQYVL